MNCITLLPAKVGWEDARKSPPQSGLAMHFHVVMWDYYKGLQLNFQEDQFIKKTWSTVANKESNKESIYLSLR